MEHTTDTSNITEKKESKKEKKRKARKALLLFLKRMRRTCSAYSGTQEWYDEMKKLKEIVSEYSGVLPEKQLSKLNKVLDKTDLTTDGITQTCEILRTNLKKLAKSLPKHGAVTSGLIKTVITVAVIAGGATIFWNTQKVELTIYNNGCSNIPIAKDIPPDIEQFIDTLSIDLPLGIVTNGHETITLPPVFMSVYATRSSIAFELLGKSISITIPGNVTSITFNDVELLNKNTSINFRDRKEHDLVISCL